MWFRLPFPLSKYPGLGCLPACCYNIKLACSLFSSRVVLFLFYFYYTLCIIFHTFPPPHNHYFWHRMARQVNLILLFQKNKCQKYTSRALALVSCPACLLLLPVESKVVFFLPCVLYNKVYHQHTSHRTL